MTVTLPRWLIVILSVVVIVHLVAAYPETKQSVREFINDIGLTESR